MGVRSGVDVIAYIAPIGRMLTSSSRTSGFGHAGVKELLPLRDFLKLQPRFDKLLAAEHRIGERKELTSSLTHQLVPVMSVCG